MKLVEKGNIDYIIFECLAERTIANNQQQKLKDPSKGYTPMLEARMRGILRQAKENGVKIVTNMGAANPEAAVLLVLEIAKEMGIADIKIAMVSGDNITDNLDKYKNTTMWKSCETLGELNGASFRMRWANHGRLFCGSRIQGCGKSSYFRASDC